MAPDPATDLLLDALKQSDQRMIRTVDSLTDDQWTGRTVLPDWSRAHVVAHLALNAEGFLRALGGIQDGEERAIYDSNAARDADIAELAAAEPSEIRERYFAATSRLRHVFGSLTDEQWGATVNRLPEGPTWPVDSLVVARRLEVEVHHADLDLGYTARDWPEDFAVRVLDTVTANHAASPASEKFSAHASDLGRTWSVGADEPVVTGTAGELGWWLMGRGNGEGVSSAHGPLPEIGPWTKPVRT
ncbi:maleylpyruvate isomerase [Marmoricola sp. OAE513]|uniref:maleylpyruvate isomerase family mycothiol-dependent enzyme n=1 Tax=Marmoricola sp. OAE513 TaxID=2817894 RepID=UPI0033982FA5